MTRLKVFIHRLLKNFGYQIVSNDALEAKKNKLSACQDKLIASRNELIASRNELIAARVSIAAYGNSSQRQLASLSSEMQSQLGQDLFALVSAQMRRKGFFVEFGAGDGVHLSNTFILEKKFGWRGILAEPLAEYHELLRMNRDCNIDTNCVWSSSDNRLEFVSSGYLSTLEAYRDSDMHSEARKTGSIYTVTTISLFDLLKKHKAPNEINFLSIDTEGSELEILKAFPWNTSYRIEAIACEHNYSVHRAETASLLQSVGYRQVCRNISAHDDWFVLADSTASAAWESTAGDT